MTDEQRGLIGREFRHFKGNRYRLEGFAKDSETLEEMVVYRALYGDGGLWVRPAKMFFETIERDGKTMKRFELLPAKNALKRRTRPTRYFPMKRSAKSTISTVMQLLIRMPVLAEVASVVLTLATSAICSEASEIFSEADSAASAVLQEEPTPMLPAKAATREPH